MDALKGQNLQQQNNCRKAKCHKKDIKMAHPTKTYVSHKDSLKIKNSERAHWHQFACKQGKQGPG